MTLEERPALSLETLRAMGEAAGLAIDDERLPLVQGVLAELMGYGMTLEALDLTGVESDRGDPLAGWEAAP
jgi:hypothetical protein